MAFILYLIAGAAAGLLGGMGMGGGTVLIPVLTIFLGVNQHVAQATNVIAFLPMAAFALSEHKKKGYLRTDGVLAIIIPALISAVAFSVVAAFIDASLLRRLFGAFLIALAVRGIMSLAEEIKSERRSRRS